jgi:hypothetical protein
LQDAPGQPLKAGKPLTFEEVGQSAVSAQQIFLGSTKKMYILDKAENNAEQVAGHPAWAVEYDIDGNVHRAMDVVTNTFCAGGGVLGNGTWINVGGNNAVGAGGATLPDAQQTTGSGPYQVHDGGLAMRFLDPCDDENCKWVDDPKMYLPTRRWYPTIETLPDGRVIIIGGNQFGGFVSSQDNNNPTYTFWPDDNKEGDIKLPLLDQTVPANLYPLTWLLPSGNLLIQSNWKAVVFDYLNKVQSNLPDIPAAVRTYPASAGTVMLPMTPGNGHTATVLFCGGNDRYDWTTVVSLATSPASDSCVRISPDVSSDWETDEPLREGRTMGNMILLPTGKILMVNGANLGTAGYGNDTWVVGGHSYADKPIHKPLLYDPEAPIGSRWTDKGLSESPINRLYHSTASLLPDGSVFVTGSNPNPDTVLPGDGLYATEYAVERWYPDYYSARRPEPKGLPNSIGYGGAPWKFTLTTTDLSGNAAMAKTIKVVLIRTGFSTHAVNMGQRYVQLEHSYAVDKSGNAVIYATGVPGPTILAPGPALLFIVVNDVPSVAVQVMVGSGKLGTQTVPEAVALPSPTIAAGAAQSSVPVKKGSAPRGAAWSVPAAIAGTIAAIFAMW